MSTKYTHDLHHRVQEELVTRIDAVRGLIPRSAWMRNALEMQVKEEESLKEKETKQ